MVRLLSWRQLLAAPLAVLLGLVASAGHLGGQPPPMGPVVTIQIPEKAADGSYTFKGTVVAMGWTAGAQCSVQITNKAGGTYIPVVFGQVNATQTAWGPSQSVQLPPGKYAATVFNRFTKGGQESKQTGYVEFEILETKQP